MKRFTNLLLPILAGLGFLIMSSLYVVDEREKALRLWFGEVTAVIVDPGLNFKVPFLHEIVKYEVYCKYALLWRYFSGNNFIQ